MKVDSVELNLKTVLKSIEIFLLLCLKCKFKNPSQFMILNMFFLPRF